MRRPTGLFKVDLTGDDPVSMIARRLGEVGYCVNQASAGFAILTRQQLSLFLRDCSHDRTGRLNTPHVEAVTYPDRAETRTGIYTSDWILDFARQALRDEGYRVVPEKIGCQFVHLASRFPLTSFRVEHAVPAIQENAEAMQFLMRSVESFIEPSSRTYGKVQGWKLGGMAWEEEMSRLMGGWKPFN